MKSKTFYTTQEVCVDAEYDVDFDDLLELVESCNKEQREKILNKIVNTNDGKRMKKLTLCNDGQEVDVEVEVDVDFSDLLDMINDCNEDELELIRDTIDGDTWLTSDNLYDEQKLKLLKTAFGKYELEELEQRLK